MGWIDLIAVAAGLGSISSFVPQLLKVFREPDPSGVSLTMYAISMATFSLWTAYGLVIDAWPLVASNATCLGLTSAIFVTTRARRMRWLLFRRIAPPSKEADPSAS